MEKIGNSSLLVEKYRPQTIKDIILPANLKTYFENIVASKDVPNMVFASSAGRGKTSVAFALCKDIGCDIKYINGSLDTSIDMLRYDVTQFAMTGSFHDAKKVVIIDECDQLSPNALNGMKALIEQVESNCRFILTTNNVSKIIEPLFSRCPLINFNFLPKETKTLLTEYFKRLCWILTQENIKFDKKILAEYTQKVYPDFRKTLMGLQTCITMYGEINENIFSVMDSAQFNALVTEMKVGKYNNIRKIICSIDPDSFYTSFYDRMDEFLQDDCKANVIMTLGRYAYETSLSVNKEVTLAACIMTLLRECKWR